MSATVAARKPGFNLLSHPSNDYGNAKRLIEMYGNGLRYCTPMKKWLIWDGCRYRLDESDTIRRLCQQSHARVRGPGDGSWQ